eukprot:TRINITY_DN2979_c0_g1_i1.p1 TRINITY_DN2979_c0_g1~~TRINITY_DN2979_c0_g1_i1.p1  ORF type:complete len:105 (-),score=28.82 TRINITY_DN2979_c0_g1_i1:222-536(-)
MVSKKSSLTRDRRRKEREEFFQSLSLEELEEWSLTKLNKKFLKDGDQLLRTWKEEKSTLLEILMEKEKQEVRTNFELSVDKLKLEQQKFKAEIVGKLNLKMDVI